MSDPATATQTPPADPGSSGHGHLLPYAPGQEAHHPTITAAGYQLGRGVMVAVDPRLKSPFMAGMLSLVPGLGQVYLGHYQRGFVHAVVVAALITLIASGGLDALIPLASVFLGFFYLFNVVDAARRAALYNLALAGREVDVPQDFTTPPLRGSLPGGVVVIAAGAVLLAHTRFGVSLDWIADWWPVAIVLFGVHLVVKAVQEKARDGAPSAGEGP